MAYTVTPANGRIFPVSGCNKGDSGQILVLQAPKAGTGARSAVSSNDFTTIAFDDKAEHLAGVDGNGNVYSFNLRMNRVQKLETAGVRCSLAFDTWLDRIIPHKFLRSRLPVIKVKLLPVHAKDSWCKPNNLSPLLCQRQLVSQFDRIYPPRLHFCNKRH